ncbi:MAG: threonine synthase [Kiloniellales bacterium]|jgi:threonine synthase|nr:threonine synthase [Kiloniellales bacterium]
MKYLSTRGRAPVLEFEEVLLAGLARDGGLYLPETWPRLGAEEIRALGRLDYPALAARIARPFVGGAFSDDELDALYAEAYAGFDHAAVAPLKQLDREVWFLELFHGPTLAFKDFALQVLGRLFDRVLARRGERVTIVGATSGDTGAAAIEACRDRPQIDVFILHPEGRVSEVQRRLMTTVTADNVHNIAIAGTFDDCQDLVKAMFNDAAFRDETNLSAVNSINWARIMAQVAYYFAAATALGAPEREVDFAVPTGNFGNVFAGYVARAMGLPVGRLWVGSNSNDILSRTFETGAMTIAEVRPTLSPAMDIQVSSNFERLLFEIYGRDGARVAALVERFRRSGEAALEPAALQALRQVFAGRRIDDRETLAEMTRLYRETGETIDPHSAVGIATARHLAAGSTRPVIALGTAHPAKFPDAVEQACGVRPALPPRLADLYQREERCLRLPNDLRQVQTAIRDRLGPDRALAS